MLFGTVEILSYVDGSEVVHVLVDELCNGDLSQVSVSFISDEPHSEDIAQGGRDEMWILANEQLEPSCKFFVRSHVYFLHDISRLCDGWKVRGPTPAVTASCPNETFQIHSKPPPGSDAVARLVSQHNSRW